MNKIFTFTILFLNIVLTQVKPYTEPLSFSTNEEFPIINISNFSKIQFQKNHKISQYIIGKNIKSLNYIDILIDKLDSDILIFLIDNSKESYIGPYSFDELIELRVGPIRGNEIILEINNKLIKDEFIDISLRFEKFTNNLNEETKIKVSKSRENPIIMVTGYWPPTNEMIRHFSQNINLNTSGWEGDNWEERGYDIVSYFPEFSDPNCSNCGQGNGDLEVDYQDTSEDFWEIFNNHSPIAVITFSRGYMNQSWEMEFNAYNRTNWINDFTSPFLPTPNPPDVNEESFFLRNSNLPMNTIINNINNLNLGLEPYIDQEGDPGHYVSEFMAYHGTWYRDLNQFGDNNCISAGHIHVGGNINWDTAKIATEETIRSLINYLDQFIYIPGDLNQDEVIDILDLIMIMNSILGITELSTLQFYASDMNEDTLINIQDIIIIINLILNNS